MHLNGRPVGPLRRVFRVNRVAVFVWLISAGVYSACWWGIPLIHGPYRILVPVVGLIGCAAFVPVWNGWLRRTAARQSK